MSFVIYDLIFLGLAIILVTLFLYRRKHNLQRQGLMYLYKTKLGIKFIDVVAKKYAKILAPLQYVVITSGYILLASGIYLMVYTTYQYVTSPILSQAIKAPPIFPLFPYFTEFFDLNSFFPPFYFTYFIIVIAIIAVSHEFAHGIFAKLNNIKIHSTGFAFLGPFLGAFVEQDDKQMNKASKFAQLSVLAAGTFANVIMAILFGLILWLFFALSFHPGGLYFNDYATSQVNISQISSMQNVSFFNQSFIQVNANNKSYFTNPGFIEYSENNNLPFFIAYDDSPAFREGITGAITMMNGIKIDSYDKLRSILQSHNPGDNLDIQTINSKGEVKDYSVTLGDRDGQAFLGIAIIPYNSRGFAGVVNHVLAKIKDPVIYYESNYGDFAWFIYNLLWWIVIINILVAVMNMLPLGILDGGRFFMLTIWGITGKKKVGEGAFKLATWLLLALLAILMVKWVVAYF